MNPNNTITTMPGENTISYDVQDAIHQMIYETVNDTNNEADEKYKTKEKLIQDAPNMSTQERLDALDQNYDRWNHERWQNATVYIGLTLGVLCIAVGGPTAVKAVRKFIAA